MLFETTLYTFAAQSVALLHAQRQKQFRRAAVRTQHFIEQRQRSHPIHIVIPEQHDAFTSIKRSENTSNRRIHLWEQKRIAQRAKTRSQEIFNFLRGMKSFPGKQPRDAF